MAPPPRFTENPRPVGEQAAQAGPPPDPQSLAARWLSHPFAHFLILAAVAVYHLVVSWRRWPDPVTDFGRELYTPWRLAAGAVLYRDVDDFYGPLSQYINAALFKVFGPGMMVLAVANIVVFATIVIVMYFIVRRLWGAIAALVGLTVFVAVFGFSRFLFAGNFNYATPYSHETTHGMLVLVLLVAALLRWLKRPEVGASAVVGFLFGLTLVLKPEFILAGAMVIGAGVFLGRGRIPPGGVAVGAGAAVLPTLAFGVYFSWHVGAAEGFAYAGRAWLSVIGTTRFVGDPAQANYAGFDFPLLHLWHQAVALAVAVAVVTGLALLVRLIFRRRETGGQAFVGGAALVGVAVLSWFFPSGWWRESGRCLPGMMLACLGYVGWRLRRPEAGTEERQVLAGRMIVVVAATAMMARMVLNARVYHFGYYQAGLAAVVATAALVTDFPALVTSQRRVRRWIAGGIAALILPGVVVLSRLSQKTYRELNSPMGEGRDRFYIFGAAAPLATVAAQLTTVSRQGVLLVLPEGLMFNYLGRLRSPLPPFFFYSAATEGGREAELVRQLAARPPDWVILVPRDLHEYGIREYGERSGAGRDLIQWVAANYEGAPGDPTPIRYRQDVLLVLQRQVTPAARRTP